MPDEQMVEIAPGVLVERKRVDAAVKRLRKAGVREDPARGYAGYLEVAARERGAPAPTFPALGKKWGALSAEEQALVARYHTAACLGYALRFDLFGDVQPNRRARRRVESNNRRAVRRLTRRAARLERAQASQGAP